VRAIFNTSVWLQAGQYLSLAAQIPAKQKSGCRPLRFAVVYGAGLPVLASHTELNQTNKSRFLRAGEAVGLAFQIDLSAKCASFSKSNRFHIRRMRFAQKSPRDAIECRLSISRFDSPMRPCTPCLLLHK
jgi:hypothetical protein